MKSFEFKILDKILKDMSDVIPFFAISFLIESASFLKSFLFAIVIIINQPKYEYEDA